MDCRITPLLKKIHRLAVIGGNPAGLNITSAALLANIPTTLVRTTPGNTAETKRKIEASLLPQIPNSVDNALTRLRLTSDLDTISTADLILDMTSLPIPARQTLLRVAERAANPNAILATNASPLLVRQLAFRLQSRESFLGMHFLTTPVLAGLCEVSTTNQTKPLSLLTALQFLRTIKKLPILLQTTRLPPHPAASLTRVVRTAG